jgi:hypothetical protein
MSGQANQLQADEPWIIAFAEKAHTSGPIALVFLLGLIQSTYENEWGKAASLLSVFCSVYFVGFAVEVWCDVSDKPKPGSRRFPFWFRLAILSSTSLLLGFCGYTCYQAYFESGEAAEIKSYKEVPASEQLVAVDSSLLLVPPVTSTSKGIMKVACLRGPSVGMSAGDCAFLFKLSPRHSAEPICIDRLRVNVFGYDETISYKTFVLPKKITIAANYFVQIDDPQTAKQKSFDANLFVSKENMRKLPTKGWLQVDSAKPQSLILRVSASKAGYYRFGVDLYTRCGGAKQLTHLIKSTDWLFVNAN